MTNELVLDFKPTSDQIALDKAFRSHGYDMRIVGGAVRDFIIGDEPSDIDFATTATPDQMKTVFKSMGWSYHLTGEAHGTITAVNPKNGSSYEITTLRIDTDTNGRHASVRFTTNWEEDAARRDLTYNAMSMDLQGRVYDYFNGIHDMKNGTVRFVGNPSDRIQEDYLRILRAFRFGAKYNHHVPKNLRQVIQENVQGLRMISGERIWQEMYKIFANAKYVEDKVTGTLSVLQHMKDTTVFSNIDIDCINIGDVGVALISECKPITALVGLLGYDADAFEKVSAHWKLSRKENGLARFLIKHHGQDVSEKEAQVMILDDICPSWIDELFRSRNMDNPVKNWIPPIFPVNGRDIIAEGINPGPAVGERFVELRQKWIDSNFVLSKSQLLG